MVWTCDIILLVILLNSNTEFEMCSEVFSVSRKRKLSHEINLFYSGPALTMELSCSSCLCLGLATHLQEQTLSPRERWVWSSGCFSVNWRSFVEEPPGSLLLRGLVFWASNAKVWTERFHQRASTWSGNKAHQAMVFRLEGNMIWEKLRFCFH